RRFFGQPRGLSPALVKGLSHLSPLTGRCGGAVHKTFQRACQMIGNRAESARQREMDILPLPRQPTKIKPAMSPETIYVAPLSLVQMTIADARVSHLVTLINDETVIQTPEGIGAGRHLRLAMNDIC